MNSLEQHFDILKNELYTTTLNIKVIGLSDDIIKNILSILYSDIKFYTINDTKNEIDINVILKFNLDPYENKNNIPIIIVYDTSSCIIRYSDTIELTTFDEQSF